MRKRSDLATKPSAAPENMPATNMVGASNAPNAALSDAGRAEADAASGSEPPAWANAGDPLNVDPGTELLVTIGVQTFFPIQFNGFAVGPFSLTVRIRDGESIAKAYARARAQLEELFETEYQIQSNSFRDRVRDARSKTG